MTAKGAASAVLTAGALLALGAIQGCGGDSGPASATTCVGAQPVGSLPGPDDTPLGRVATYVDATARHYPTSFTGLSVNAAAQAADVYRIPSKAFDADICGAAEKGVTVRLHDTDVSKVDLDALAARVSADMHRWDGTFSLREVGVASEGYVSIGVDDPAKATPILTKAFGSQYLKVRHVEQASAV